MIRPIKILKDLVESTAHTVEVQSIVDNGGNSYTIETCNTFYLTIGKTFQINSVTYTITDFVLNESITFTGASLPSTTSFTIDPPLFIYGTPKEVNAEFLKRSQWTRYPFIWLVEISNTEHDTRPDSRIKTTPNFFLLFLDCVDKTAFLIDDHYQRVIDCQLNEIDYFIRVLKRRKDLFEPEDLTYTTTNHCNFGDYITNRGYDRQILSDNLSGAQLQLNLPYITNTCLPCNEPIISICQPVSVSIDGVFSEYVNAGGSYNCVTGGGGSFIYDLYFDGVDTTQNVTVDGTDITINLV